MVEPLQTSHIFLCTKLGCFLAAEAFPIFREVAVLLALVVLAALPRPSIEYNKQYTIIASTLPLKKGFRDSRTQTPQPWL